MFVLALNFIQEAAHDGEGFLYNTLAARWFNLILFVGVLVFLLRKPVQNFFTSRRDSIRRDLIKAQEERAAAVAKLAEVEAKLAQINTESERIRIEAKAESAAERERLAQATEQEIKKMREQAQREIESAGKLARHDLQRYAAEQSVQLAEQIVRRDIRPEDDRRLIGDYVETLKERRN